MDARGKRESVFQGNVQNAGSGFLPYRGVLHIPGSVHRSPRSSSNAVAKRQSRVIPSPIGSLLSEVCHPSLRALILARACSPAHRGVRTGGAPSIRRSSKATKAFYALTASVFCKPAENQSEYLL